METRHPVVERLSTADSVPLPVRPVGPMAHVAGVRSDAAPSSRAIDTLAPRTFAQPTADTLAGETARSADTVAAPPRDTAAIDRPPLAVDGLPGPFDMITNLPSDWWYWTRTTFTVDNIPLIGGMTALTAGLVATDYETWQPFKKWYESSKTVRDVNDAFVFVGDGKFQFGIAGAFAAWGFLFNDTTALRTASQTVEVILGCGAVVQLLKHITGRESPFTATTPTGRWALFPSPIEYHKHVPHYDAFPSGHIATALATLTVVMENYPDEDWLAWVGYPVVAMVGVGLAATSIHWWSDFPLGLLLGYQFGKLVARHNRPSTEQSGPQLGVSVLSGGTPALSMQWRW